MGFFTVKKEVRRSWSVSLELPQYRILDGLSGRILPTVRTELCGADATDGVEDAVDDAVDGTEDAVDDLTGNEKDKTNDHANSKTDDTKSKKNDNKR